jgi:hypothetical protein
MDLVREPGNGMQNSQTEEKPWDRQPGESAKAYRAFTLYRDKQADRTFESVAGLLQCSGTNIRRWAKRWNWADRVRAHDIHSDRIELDVLSRERLAMKKRMARQGIDMQAAAADGLSELLRLIKRKKRPLRLSASDIARLAEVGGKLERYARGDDDEQYGTFEIRVHIDDPPPDNADDLAAAKDAVHAALREG